MRLFLYLQQEVPMQSEKKRSEGELQKDMRQTLQY